MLNIKPPSGYYAALERRAAKAQEYRRDVEKYIAANWSNPAAMWARKPTPPRPPEANGSARDGRGVGRTPHHSLNHRW